MTKIRIRRTPSTGGGNETAHKLAWSAALVGLAVLIAATGLLLARRPGGSSAS